MNTALSHHEFITVAPATIQKYVLDFSAHTATDYFVTITVQHQATAQLLIRAPKQNSYSLHLMVQLEEANSEITCWIAEELHSQNRALITTAQHHTAPHAKSTVIIRSVVRDAAQSEYHGIIRVEEEARGTIALQNSATLLLGETAKSQATPSLEILTDDVSCKHGSSCGTVSAEHLWYMQTRGIEILCAQELLVTGFLDIGQIKL